METKRKPSRDAGARCRPSIVDAGDDVMLLRPREDVLDRCGNRWLDVVEHRPAAERQRQIEGPT